MNKLEYFKLALKNQLYKNKNWLLKAFSITRGTDTSTIPFDILIQPWGYSVNDDDKTKISDGKPDTPLYLFTDTITLDSTDLPNITDSVETTIGIAIFNAICLVSPFGSKVSYINKQINLSEIEDMLAKRLVSNEVTINYEVIQPLDTEGILVSELLTYIEALDFISTLSQLTSPVVTKKTITPPTGIDDFKKELLKKFEGKLDNPIELVKFEDALLAFDDEYLKDDPTYNKFLKGKVKDVARKKMFLTYGAGQSFDVSGMSKPIISSLNDGWSQDPEDIISINNDIRVGSYSRGVETIKGGVSAKYLLRSGNSFVIETDDCGTKLGIPRKYTERNIKKLINRYIIQGGAPILITDETNTSYVGKDVIVRSPGFCILEGDRICKTCAGGNLNRFPKGLTIPLTEISSIILNAALKKMHGSKLATTKLDINLVLS